ncbi:c-type cytochrome [Stieleria neptunia]|uniref:c-type cytochrome n=1 Tax=Stieleria neptunia TaxID=2527979 RepID=UPI0018D22043|nr:c-type cytochrome [Stieleria neptunia]
MNRILLAGLLFALGCHAIRCPAQPLPQPSLTDRLLAEDSGSLAALARERGDAVRGAILFSTQSLACTKCHAQGAADLLGPDLTEVSAERNDETIVEAILQPSKSIAKGFESVKILTQEGRVATGRVIRQDADTIVLRELSDANRLIEIARDDIDRMEPQTVSAMPTKLADQLTDRQQFLDLVKYLMDIAQTGHTPHVAASVPASRITSLDPQIHGTVLLDQFGCVRCHDDNAAEPTMYSSTPPKQAPLLTAAASRIDPHYIRRFIADPHGVKPGTSMPDLMQHLSDADREAASTAITQYLMSLTTEPFQRGSIDDKSASRGRELFHSVGCVACHSPRGDDGDELMADRSVALGDLSRKYSIDGLSAFLENPHSVRPSGRMPDMKLTHWEAVDLANYLVSGAGADVDRQPMPTDPDLIRAGRQSFNELGCVQCHVAEHGQTQPVQGRGRAGRYPSLAELNTTRGCLSGEPGAWANYQLDDTQRDAIRVALKSSAATLDDREQVVLTMATFRCDRCHTRDGWGGVSDQRDPYFHTSNENLGPQGRIPPPLSGVGGKLRSKWLRDVLVSGRSIRPYMKTRMPQYGAANVADLIDRFASVDPKPLVEIIQTQDPKEARKTGLELVGNGGLNCIACHTFQHKPAQTMPAVDLTEMAERLHREWFYQYMVSPQLVSPGTVMPSFWPGGKAIRKEILGGDPNLQIGAVWEYLLEGRQARTPRGLQLEPIRLLADRGRAVMLRRSYQGIGKRGIGVGYPGGLNLAFDAEQMRLAMIWKGDFADPGGVWRGQGHGTVRPLGSDLIRFQPGPDLDDAQTPWIVDEGRPPHHQFIGYDLDDIGRPTWMYRWGVVEISDYAVDSQDADSEQTVLKRAVKFTSKDQRDNLVFRVASGENVKAIDGQSFLVDDKLSVRIDPEHQADILQSETGMQLIVPLSLSPGSTTLEVQYRW